MLAIEGKVEMEENGLRNQTHEGQWLSTNTLTRSSVHTQHWFKDVLTTVTFFCIEAFKKLHYRNYNYALKKKICYGNAG